VLTGQDRRRCKRGGRKGGKGEGSDQEGGRMGGKRRHKRGRVEPRERDDLCLSDLSG